MSPNLRGSLFMILAMAAFAVEDMAIKAAAARLPMGEVLTLFGLGGMVIFAALAKAQGEIIFHPALRHPALIIRAGFEVSGRLFYMLALALTSLSGTSAILQATPLIVILGAALLFGEKVSPQRWAAVGAGLLGVMLILKPGPEGFSALSLLAVLGTLGFAGRDLATRAAPKVLSNRQLGTYGFAAILPAGLGLWAWQGSAPVVPGPVAGGALAGAVIIGVLAYNALTRAMRTGDVGFVTPFRYTRLVFALLLAVLVFGERPDAWVLLGAALVVASGIYAMVFARG